MSVVIQGIMIIFVGIKEMYFGILIQPSFNCGMKFNKFDLINPNGQG